MVVAIDVEDPMGLEPGDKIRVLRSTRNDPLAGMHARKTIDEAQYWGGRDFQRDFEAAERGFTAVKHQREVGTGYFDAVTQAIQQGQSSTTALTGSTEEEQFH